MDRCTCGRPATRQLALALNPARLGGPLSSPICGECYDVEGWATTEPESESPRAAPQRTVVLQGRLL